MGEPLKTLTEGKQYEFARKVLTGEANAAAQGAFEGGATGVVVDDAHGSGLNLIYDQLDPRVRVLLGVPRPRRFETLDSTFAGIFFIGYHPMAGKEKGVLSHSYSSTAIQNMWLNGRLIGEIGMDGALAGSVGVPVLLVTSCEEGTREAREFLGNIETVAVKQGLSRNCALSLTPSAACEMIRDAAKKAVQSRSRARPFVVPGPYEVMCEYKFESLADRIRPGEEKVGPRTVSRKGDDLFLLI